MDNEWNSKVRMKRSVYLILLGILVLAAATQISRTQLILQFSRNGELLNQSQGQPWRPRAADPAGLQPSGKPYCIAFDGQDDYSMKLADQSGRVLDYMKKPKLAVDLRKEPLDPAACVVIVSTVEDMGMLGDTEALIQSVKQGGYVMIIGKLAVNDAFYRLYRSMGILKSGIPVNSMGLKMTSNLLIGEHGLLIEDDSIENSVLSVELDEKARVLARSAEDVPLIWEYACGQGKFMVFNSTMQQMKISRGLLAGAISLLEPDFIYPVFNMNLMYIDDFPAPVGKTVDPEIYREYGRDRPAFFKDIWWPDMLKAAKRYNLTYTAVLIESYNDQVVPPFASPSDQDMKGLISIGREVIKSGGEIGLHGYNHQSLTLDKRVADIYGYHAWASADAMAESIGEAIHFMKSAFPNYTMINYVPPSNVLSPEGREALKRAWPDLAAISSLYNDDSNGISYVQEYEIAPDGIVELPRVTSGYTETPFNRFMEASTMTTLGILSHFIHPDDLLDQERSGNLSWRELYDQFSDMLSRREHTYPWIRPVTGTKAAIDMERMLNSRVDWSRGGGRLQGNISPFEGEMYFVLRSVKEIRSLKHCTADKIDAGTYLITAHRADFEIVWGD